MKRFVVFALAFLALLPSGTAFAEKSVYVLGGVTLSNLGGDISHLETGRLAQLDSSHRN